MVAAPFGFAVPFSVAALELSDVALEVAAVGAAANAAAGKAPKTRTKPTIGTANARNRHTPLARFIVEKSYAPGYCRGKRQPPARWVRGMGAAGFEPATSRV